MRLAALYAVAIIIFTPLMSHTCRAEALMPPIDRNLWMVSSPSQPLRVLKRPGYGGSYPQLADYMRVLERFPLLGERGWRDNYMGEKGLGFFGDPDSAEMGLRSMGNYIFTMSLLASEPAYDESVTGVSRQQVLSRARSCLAYMTRSHVTGDMTCGDGKKWGDHWQSAWWTAKMALGARLIWENLTAQERSAVERVVVHEADRHLERKAPGKALSDTKSEENAWDTEVLAAAIALFPNHQNAAAWRAKLIDFELNSLSAPSHQTSGTLVDGKPLRDQVYTTNIHDDFTIENHGAYHVCYMSCPLHSLAWGYYALTSTGQPIPQAQFHGFTGVWNRLKPTFLERRFAYIEGKDWPRYAYGMYFIMPALVVLQQKFGDDHARAIEALRFKTFEQEQMMNADGTFFGKRFTRNIMMHRELEYETDCYANLGVCYLLHKMSPKPPARPMSYPRLSAEISSSHISEPARFASARTPELFASFAWKALDAAFPTLLFIPNTMDDAAEWGSGNGVGRIDVAGAVPRQGLIKSHFASTLDGFYTRGSVTYPDASGKPLYSVNVTCDVDMRQKQARVKTSFVAENDVDVLSVEGLRLLVASDIWNNGRRLYTSESGAFDARFDVGAPRKAQETLLKHELGNEWVNIDGRLGVIRLSRNPADFVLRQSDSRNSAWGSLHFDALDCPVQQQPPKPRYSRGEAILETEFLFIAGDAKRTAELAARFSVK